MSIDPDLEGLLRRYEPSAPPPELRGRVLGPSRPGAGWRGSLPWLSLAASLVLSYALGRATAAIERRLANSDAQSLGAQALIEGQDGPEWVAVGLVHLYARRDPMPRWPGTALSEGELP